MGNRSIALSYPKTPIAGSMHPVSSERVETEVPSLSFDLGEELTVPKSGLLFPIPIDYRQCLVSVSRFRFLSLFPSYC